VEHTSHKGTATPISWFPVPEETGLPDDLWNLLRKAREKIGFVPDVFGAYSFRPERLRAWFGHYERLHEPTDNLDAAERKMIAIAASMANGCLYCLVAQGRQEDAGSSPRWPRRAPRRHPGLRARYPT
jgi:uncharacterized peroxidase-related enzyme